MIGYRRRPIRLASLALALTASLGLAACASQEAAGSPEPAPAAPEFQLAALDGSQLGTADYPGKVIVVDFWATWCAPCHVQADILRELYAKVRGDGVQFLAISLGEDEETVRAFAEEHPFPYPVLLDPDDRLSEQVGIYALPTVMVIDSAGKIAYLESGISTANTLEKVLARTGIAVPAA